MLRVRNLEAGYSQLKVLRGISVHVGMGEIVTVIGANGAGKSTFLNTVAGVLRPRAGEVLFDGQPIGGLSAYKVVARGCALVPEGRLVFAPLSVAENLILGAYPQYRRRKSAQVGAQLERVYGLFPVLRDRQGQLAGTLSGGEQQMLAIGRALMADPRLIMLDEPSMGLAPLIVKNILATIAALRDDGVTILLVEQNSKAALGIADRGYVLETGNVVLEGTAEELLNNNDVQRAYLGKEYQSIAER